MQNNLILDIEKFVEDTKKIIRKEKYEIYDEYQVLKNYIKNHQLVYDNFNKIFNDNIFIFDSYRDLYEKYSSGKLELSIIFILIIFINIIYITLFHSLGDTIGFKNGEWEFNMGEKNVSPEYVNELIYNYISIGADISTINFSSWKASDDTLFYYETFKVLLENYDNLDYQNFGEKLREAYLRLYNELEDTSEIRAPGKTTMESLRTQRNIKWNELPYNPDNKGAGPASRAGCIGIFLNHDNNKEMFAAYCDTCSRITHNSGIAILGAYTAALFTYFSISKENVNLWPFILLENLKDGYIDKHIKNTRPHEYSLFLRDKVIFMSQWEKYINFRFHGQNPRTDLKFITNLVLRYKYLSENFSKGHTDFAGSCGDDSVIMAYDALLSSDNIQKLVYYAALIPGDSDTVAALAFSWFAGIKNTFIDNYMLSHYIRYMEYYNKYLALFANNMTTFIKIILKYYRIPSD
jgi:ADP-ribosylglycohydrolase